MGFNLKRIAALSYDASVIFPETRISWPVRSFSFGFDKVPLAVADAPQNRPN
jgi:hypothetical protein